jgi:hypothetical protein
MSVGVPPDHHWPVGLVETGRELFQFFGNAAGILGKSYEILRGGSSDDPDRFSVGTPHRGDDSIEVKLRIAARLGQRPDLRDIKARAGPTA